MGIAAKRPRPSRRIGCRRVTPSPSCRCFQTYSPISGHYLTQITVTVGANIRQYTVPLSPAVVPLVPPAAPPQADAVST